MEFITRYTFPCFIFCLWWGDQWPSCWRKIWIYPNTQIFTSSNLTPAIQLFCQSLFQMYAPLRTKWSTWDCLWPPGRHCCALIFTEMHKGIADIAILLHGLHLFRVDRNASLSSKMQGRGLWRKEQGMVCELWHTAQLLWRPEQTMSRWKLALWSVFSPRTDSCTT